MIDGLSLKIKSLSERIIKFVSKQNSYIQDVFLNNFKKLKKIIKRIDYCLDE
jgi:hypothetical protein